jgi:porin
MNQISILDKKAYSIKLFSFQIFVLIPLLFLFASPLYSAEESLLNSENISGSWGGYRTSMSEKGVEFEFVYSGEIYSNASGGVNQKTIYHDNYDLIASIDANTLLGLKGGLFNFYVLGNGGKSLSENIGDMQTASNIDTDPAGKLYEAWYQQTLMDETVSLLIGLFDLNSEFDCTETAGLFLNSSHGIGPDFSQTGMCGPSIFPTTSLTIRGQYAVNDEITTQVAVLDGVPGDPEKISGTHIKFDDNDGLLTVAEVYYSTESEKGKYCKYSLGAWSYTGDFEEIEDPTLSGNGNSGFYAMAEKQIFSEKEFGDQGFAAFTRLGFANTTYNQIGNYLGFGGVYTGLLPGRDEDQFGVAVAIAMNGTKFKDTIELSGGSVDNSETNIEVTYNAGVLPWLSMQADLQYIINPGTNPNLDDALALGLRFSLSF